MKSYKPIESLKPIDFETTQVWAYTNSDKIGETVVRPIKKIPVNSLTGKLVATQVCLANKSVVWALVGNVDSQNSQLTEHFLTISLYHNDKWFTLARYHDINFSENGPEALAFFLGLGVDDVFPISYDLSRFAKGEQAALVGMINKEPREKLTRAEIIALAIP